MKFRRILAFLNFFVVFLLLMSQLAVCESGPGSSNVTNNVTLDTKAIDAYIQREMENGNIPGLALGIVHGDQIEYLKGYGTANSKNDPVTPQTPFYIGSIGKTFTALSIRQLINTGLIDLNAPVSTYVPWFSLKDVKGHEITIKNLLNHTSGLSTAQGNLPYTFNAKYSIEDAVRLINERETLARPIGSEEEYSNLDYVILGLVVEAVSNQTFDDYSQKNIYEPLEMTHTYNDEKNAKENGLADGYRIINNFRIKTTIPQPTAHIPAGYQISSAEDMTKYIVAYLNNGFINNTTIIPNNSMRQFEDSLHSFDEGDLYYDIYWQETSGRRTDCYNGFYGHAGATPNMNSFLILNQELHYGIIVLTNGRDCFEDAPIASMIIGNGIADIILGKSTNQPIYRTPHYSLYLPLGLMLLFTLYRAYTLIRFRKPSKNRTFGRLKIISMALLDLLLPLTLLIGLPLYYDATWAFFLGFTPEYSLAVFYFSIVLVIIGAVKGLILIICKTTGTEIKGKNEA